MLALKHFHMSLAALTVLGFLIRSVWLFRGSQLLQKKIVKILPHVIDTFLLASGIVLMVQTKMYPQHQPWLTVKILLIVTYILFGIKMFHATESKKRLIFFLLAIASIFAVLYLARFKPLLW